MHSIILISTIVSAFSLQRFSNVLRPRSQSFLQMSAPIVQAVDEQNNIANMVVTLSPQSTQKAFQKACDLFNEEVKTKGYKVDGFRAGAKLPPAYIVKIFSQERLNAVCAQLLTEDIQDECEKTGLKFVGRGRILKFNEEQFVAGKEHTIELECDLWPDISYGKQASGQNDGYNKLKISVVRPSIDMDKYNSVKKNILERYKELEDTTAGYISDVGDVVLVNMKGFSKNADGSKGDPLPAIAAGDGVEVILEKGKFMEGFMEGLLGTQAGDTRAVSVKFPVRPSGPGAALSGKEAVFDVTVLSIKRKSLPAWNEELAKKIRPELTLELLEAEVRQAIEGDSVASTENTRNDGIAAALLEIISVRKLPESLMEESTQSRFETMLIDFKEQGSTDEQIEEMTTEENYKRYKEISRPNIEKIVKLGMAFRDIAEKENVTVEEKEIREQLDMMYAQAKQKNEQPPDERRARDEIENQLLRRKVFNLLASTADITWTDPVPEPEA